MLTTFVSVVTFVAGWVVGRNGSSTVEYLKSLIAKVRR